MPKLYKLSNFTNFMNFIDFTNSLRQTPTPIKPVLLCSTEIESSTVKYCAIVFTGTCLEEARLWFYRCGGKYESGLR